MIKLFSLLVSGVFGLVVEVVVWKFRKLESDESLLVDMKWYFTCLDYSVPFTSLALQMTAAVQYLDNGNGWNGLLMIACQVLSSVLSMLLLSTLLSTNCIRFTMNLVPFLNLDEFYRNSVLNTFVLLFCLGSPELLI